MGLIVFLQYSFYVKLHIKYPVLRTMRTHVGYVCVCSNGRSSTITDEGVSRVSLRVYCTNIAH
jgi:hypothetical protein